MWSITIENTKNKGISLRQKKWIKKNIIQHLVSLGRSSSPLHMDGWMDHSKFVRLWGSCMYSPLWGTIHIFWKVWALTGPFQNFDLLLLKPFFVIIVVLKSQMYLRCIYSVQLSIRCLFVSELTGIWSCS